MGVVSMELFDATPREFSVLDYLFNPNSTAAISSLDAPAPLEVVSQAYWSRAPSRFLSVTSTRQGITSRQLLVGTVMDQVGLEGAGENRARGVEMQPALSLWTGWGTRTLHAETSPPLHPDVPQLYAMDLRFLDPRRPRTQKPSAQEVEERLIPYQENLPFAPNSFATYDKQVLYSLG